MTLHVTRDEIHADLTWLIGAIARAVHGCCRDNPGVLFMLHALAEADLSTGALKPLPQKSARACSHLPLALARLLAEQEEVAQALAGAWEHLRWRDLASHVAEAPVVGSDGPFVSARVSLSVLVLGEGARYPWPVEQDRSRLHVALLGRMNWTVENGMRLLMQAPMSLFVEAGCAATCRVEQGPALLVSLSTTAPAG